MHSDTSELGKTTFDGILPQCSVTFDKPQDVLCGENLPNGCACRSHASIDEGNICAAVEL